MTLSGSPARRLTWMLSVAAMLATMAALPLSAQNLPYWMQGGFQNFGERFDGFGGRNLIGRSFLFRSATDRPEPRYGRLTLFTFTETELRERRPMVDVSHPITYVGSFFGLRDSPARLRFNNQGVKGRFDLYRVAGEYEGAPRERLGSVQEVAGAEIQEILALITTAEKAELAQRQAEVKASLGSARPSVDLHDAINGDVVEAVYLGNFGRTPQENDDLRIQALYVAYHKVFGDKFGREIAGATVRFEERTDTYQGSGLLVARGEPSFTAVVRERFADTFDQARRADVANVESQSVNMMTAFMSMRPTSLANVGSEMQQNMAARLRPYDFSAAVSLFLDQLYRTSPPSIERLEQNLDRYIKQQPPVVMPGALTGPAKYAALSAWTPRSTPGAVVVQGMSWTPPPAWLDYDFPGATAAYNVDDGRATVYVYKRKPGGDLLASINSARSLARYGIAPLTSVEQARMEVFDIGGMAAQVGVFDNLVLAYVDSADARWTLMFRVSRGTPSTYKDEVVRFLRTWKPAQG